MPGTESYEMAVIAQENFAIILVRCLTDGRISSESSILIVVGREDTGALEAQIRGSRHAWDVRLISVERLAKLLQIKEKSNSDATVRQIRELLQPFEYTKIDRIIDVIFSTAEDVEQQVDTQVNEGPKMARM